VLVIGGGGRAHAVVHALAHSPQVVQVFASPGNFGTATASTRHCSCQNVPLMTHNEVVRFVEQHEVSLVVVGPERPLADGLVDLLQEKVWTQMKHLSRMCCVQTLHFTLCYTDHHIIRTAMH